MKCNIFHMQDILLFNEMEWGHVEFDNNNTSKKRGHDHVYSCVASPLHLTRVCKHLGAQGPFAGPLGERCCFVT